MARDEASANALIKVGKRLSLKTRTSVETAKAAAMQLHQHLTDLLGADADQPSDSSEEEDMEKAEMDAALDAT